MKYIFFIIYAANFEDIIYTQWIYTSTAKYAKYHNIQLIKI